MAEWTKCSERMPIDCFEVSYLGINSCGFMAAFSRLEVKAVPPDSAPIDAIYAWAETPEESFVVMSGVTHWMPLPEPPK